MNATWDTENDALESQLAEWFPNGIAVADTRLTDETDDLDAALAALIEWVD